MKAKLKSGDEMDALTSFHRLLHWRAGMRKLIKRRFNKRFRRAGRLGAQRRPE
jgi:hypothetical protein